MHLLVFIIQLAITPEYTLIPANAIDRQLASSYFGMGRGCRRQEM